jgi:hypothetical protein
MFTVIKNESICVTDCILHMILLGFSFGFWKGKRYEIQLHKGATVNWIEKEVIKDFFLFEIKRMIVKMMNGICMIDIIKENM